MLSLFSCDVERRKLLSKTSFSLPFSLASSYARSVFSAHTINLFSALLFNTKYTIVLSFLVVKQSGNKGKKKIPNHQIKKDKSFDLPSFFFFNPFDSQSLALQTHDTILHTHPYMDISICCRQSGQFDFE